MLVLVAVASKHGGTKEIASRIGSRLEAHGHAVRVVELGHQTPLQGVDAYVLGSAVYGGQWMKTARRFLSDHAAELRRHPVWLFSSGPLGERAVLENAVDHPEQMATLVHALDHHVFGGRLDHHDLSAFERVVAGAVHAPEGDYRDWDDVDAWAHAIAAELDQRPTHAAAS